MASKNVTVNYLCRTEVHSSISPKGRHAREEAKSLKATVPIGVTDAIYKQEKCHGKVRRCFQLPGAFID
jgi:hypothetical protein